MVKVGSDKSSYGGSPSWRELECGY
jgi:hypothetical protein